MNFKKYNSIENSYQQDIIDAIITQVPAETFFVVQEKIHGANLSFITNGETIIAAKRTELIADNEEFYNSKTVQQQYTDRILALHKEVAAIYGNTTTTIFGELFGGGYPHPDVPKDETAQLVQRGIYYCPQNNFFAFDILLDDDKYLDADTAAALFEKFGFTHAQTLFRGTLTDCLAYPNEFKTIIPATFGLPELDGNICEGVVIKPVQPIFLRNGSRVIVKNKNEKWAENNNYIDRETLRKLLKQSEEELSEAAELLCEEAYKLITLNRLANLLSKTGNINPEKDMGKVLGLYSKDVLTDFLKTHNTQYEALEKPEAKAVNKFVNKHAGLLIAGYFDK